MPDEPRTLHTSTAPQPEDVTVADEPPQPPPSKGGIVRTRRAAIVTAVLALAGVLLILWAWRLPPFTSAQERTENAYVRGQVTVISPQVSGYVDQVLVYDFQHVKAGQPLFRIDSRIYRQRVEQAQATLSAREAEMADLVQTGAARAAAVRSREAEIGSAKAQLARAQADMARVSELARDGSVAVRELDQVRAQLRVAQAQVGQTESAREIARQDLRSVPVARLNREAAVEGAKAAVRLAQIDLDNTVINAPEPGQLGQVGARRGQYVTAGSQLVSIVPAQFWVIANFKEGQTARMSPGQKATVAVDALGGRKFTGRVQEISPATGSEFSVLPAQNATGNFTKIAQRLPVRIVLDRGQQDLARLRPGMSVVATVDTASPPEARR
jgi:multidrug resistance efflux pump